MSDYGIRKLHESLRNRLADYLKAQYFAKNSFMEYRINEILNISDSIAQEPYIEAGKKYCSLKDGFESANISEFYKKILKEFVSNKFPPYIHQIKSIENFINGKDLLVTTGTGSGKTECFLWNIYCQIINEAANNASWSQEGIRVLLLYPMNALVSDQLGRIRETVGNQKFSDIIHSFNPNARIARFGMYTGRTSYAGDNNIDKNKKYGKMLKEEFLDASEEKIEALNLIHRIPSKNMEEFINNLLNGIQKTSDNDAELLTRYEMQNICPDILITNYCMLEYMLMRPIEQSIWQKTKNWLNLSKDNKLTIVLDEAHMYKGSSGGEVSLLIRRLMSRLNIQRNKLKFILTTASMPSQKNEEVLKFACDVSCQSIENQRFEIIKAEYQIIYGNKKGNEYDLKTLNDIDYNKINSNAPDIISEILKLAERYDWIISKENIYTDLFYYLSEFPVMLELIDICGNKGKAFSEIADSLFICGTQKEKEYATEVLFALGAKAKSETGQILLSSKLHLLFKGFDGIFACLNKNCPKAAKVEGIELGFIDNKMHYFCPHCNSRMFELMNDRRCGTLFIKCFVLKNSSMSTEKQILWQNAGSMSEDLDEKHFWIVPSGIKPNDIFSTISKERKTREARRKTTNFAYIHTQTGVLFNDDKYENDSHFIKVLLPLNKETTFITCPNCGKIHNKITNFATRGNEPFTNIAQEQLECQPVVEPSLKNGGKKVLLFSDSRQKAAKLAKDITRNSDITASRKAIFCAIKHIENYNTSDFSFELLYKTFLYFVNEHDLYFYYGNESQLLYEHRSKLYEYCQRRNKRNKSYDFNAVKEIDDKSIPDMYYKYILKAMCDAFNSMQYLCLVELMLMDDNEDINDKLYDFSEENNIEYKDVLNLINALIQKFSVDDIALFSELKDDVRKSVLPYDRTRFGIEMEKDGLIPIPEYMVYILKNHNINDNTILNIRKFFNNLLSTSKQNFNHNRKYLTANQLTVKSGERKEWFHCKRCAGNASYTIFNHCIHCGSELLEILSTPADFEKYSFWRKPILESYYEKNIKNIITEEHTAQLSYKDKNAKMWSTTEEYEMRFRNIVLDDSQLPIDILSCTTTMEVGIDIGKLIAVGLRNVPPMRENYQQRAGRAGRSGSALSSIITYTENGPHDAWYYSHPSEIISGEPRTPWIDVNNDTLFKRHLTIVLIENYCLMNKQSLDVIPVYYFTETENTFFYENIIKYCIHKIETLSDFEKNTLIPKQNNFNWDGYKDYIHTQLTSLARDIINNPIKYRKFKEYVNSDDTLTLQDVLFQKGLLPTYSFPRNVVNFWIENNLGKIEQSPERSIDIALSEYSPGKMVVVNKRSYISGALYDHYTKYSSQYRYKQAEAWLNMNEYNMIAYICTDTKCCGWADTIPPKNMLCPLCNKNVEARMMVKPWGFTSVDGKEIPESIDDQRYSSTGTPSYASLPMTDKMTIISTNTKVEPRKEQTMTIINKGPLQYGYKLCRKCGAIVPSIDFEDNNNKDKEIKRPYKVPYQKDDQKKCSHDWTNTYLGYKFTTDMFVLEIHLDNNTLNLTDRRIWLYSAIKTFAEAFALSSAKVLDIEFTDIKSGYRIRNYNNELYVDIYIYDNITSGAGYSNQIANVLNDVFDDMEIRLGKCNCEKSCPKCVHHFWNQTSQNDLNRKRGLELLLWIRYNKLRKKIENFNQCVESIKNIISLCEPQLRFEYNNNEIHIIYQNIKKKVFIYPSMLSQNFLPNNIIAIPDTFCVESPAKVWEKIKTIFD